MNSRSVSSPPTPKEPLDKLAWMRRMAQIKGTAMLQCVRLLRARREKATAWHTKRLSMLSARG